MSRSKFPEGVDEFKELFDLPFDKIQDAKRLTELKMQAKLSTDEENELMRLTTSLEDYIITPETMNKFSDALVAVEKFFYSNVQGFIEERQKLWRTYVDQFKFIGKWSTGVEYKEQNLVSNSNGDLYICKKDHRSNGDEPTSNTLIWGKLSAKGDKGDIGLNAIYKGDWNKSTTYKLGDAVTYIRQGEYGGITYIAKKENVGKIPSDSKDDWMLYQQLYVSDNRPLDMQAGMHFIKDID